MPWRFEHVARPLLAAALTIGAAGAARADALRLCEDPAPLSAAQQDRFLRFAGVVKDTLEQSGERVALISRSGLDLSRFDTLYSHAGISARANRNAPWSVRQLYYACDEHKPRIFDQGVVGFLYGADELSAARASVVFLPGPAGDALERAALDDRRVLRLLGATYSANAYPFAQRYQNCNQWVMELLATAWGDTDAGADDADARAAAQRWLQAQAYVPTRFEVNPLLSWAAVLVPWLHHDDHPAEAIAQASFQVSMPASIEAFVRARVPGATRIEFCRTERQVVVRHGWQPLAFGCRPVAGDTVVPLV